MIGVVALLFLVVPFAELYVLLQVGRAIGALDTIALLVLVSLVGSWLVRREGLGVLRRIQEQVERGRMPGRELVDGGLILLAGALLVTPGFLSDVVGILLLFPPTRAALRALAVRRLAGRVAVHRGPYDGPYRGPYPGP